MYLLGDHSRPPSEVGCQHVPVERGGGGGVDDGAGLHRPALAGARVLVLPRDADARPALAGAGVLVPPPLEVDGALALLLRQLRLAPAEAGLLVEHLAVVVAAGQGALAAARTAVLLDLNIEMKKIVSPQKNIFFFFLLPVRLSRAATWMRSWFRR